MRTYSTYASYLNMTIRAVLIFNNYGRPRLTKFYSHLPTDRQQALIQLIFQIVSRRDETSMCNFLDAPELTPFLPPTTENAWTKVKDPTLPIRDVDGGNASINDNAELDPWLDYMDEKAPKPEQNLARRWRPDDELRVIYRHYATLYFVLVVDQSENELGILDLIQVLVEALDQSFENVCELDLIFHFDEVHAIVDQIVQGGLVLETNLSQIVSAVQSVQQARASSTNAGTPSTGASPSHSASSTYLPMAWGPLSFSALAEQSSDALGVIQQFGSQYWQAIQSNSSRPSPMRSRFL